MAFKRTHKLYHKTESWQLLISWLSLGTKLGSLLDITLRYLFGASGSVSQRCCFSVGMYAQLCELVFN